MTTQTINKISKSVLIGTILLMLFCLMGCTKSVDPVQSSATAAHQQIIAIRETLPKECQTKAIDEQLKAHDATVETIVTNCNIQREKITAEKIRWKWAFFALALIMLTYFGRKVLKIGL